MQAINHNAHEPTPFQPFSRPQSFSAEDASVLSTLARLVWGALSSGDTCAFLSQRANPLASLPTQLGVLDAQRKAQYIFKDELGAQVCLLFTKEKWTTDALRPAMRFILQHMLYGLIGVACASIARIRSSSGSVVNVVSYTV
jgi:hypothetical protein